MSDGNILWNSGEDAEMNAAMEEASRTFKYFWRELSWEYQRIIPALDMAMIKLEFSDGDGASNPEHMWVKNIMFDGNHITGELVNVPNRLRSVKQGDPVKTTVADISDWMFVSRGKVYGAHTVNLIRSRMGSAERAGHDEAWGLDFGDPSIIKLEYVQDQDDNAKKPRFKLFSKPKTSDLARVTDEHPMCVNTAENFVEELAKNPDPFTSLNDRGWAYIHYEALAGNGLNVKALLDAGVDPNIKTKDGKTALDLAKTLEWDHVIALFD